MKYKFAQILLRNFRKEFISDHYERSFIEHNEKFMTSNSSGRSKIALFELNDAGSPIIAYSYLARSLSEKFENVKLVAFCPVIPASYLSRVAWWLRKKIKNRLFRIYESFAIEELLVPSNLSKIRKEVELIYFDVSNKILAKSDIVNLKVGDILIGDLLYDSYLSFYKKTSIDIQSKKFRQFLKRFIYGFVFWQNFFKENDIVAINVSHTVYENGIPARIAIKNGVATFQINATHVYRLNDKNQMAYLDFHNFPAVFRSLPQSIRENGLGNAEKRIRMRLHGDVGVDMPYSTKSAYGSFKEYRLVEKSERTKILIAPHCFFDSPHPYGLNLFPDCFEWLEFIVRISGQTNYDWYVKTHPDFLPGTKKMIEQFFLKYPKFKLLPPDSSHRQLVAEGINVALTIYGTIGFEYAAMGISVVNASVNNPHVAYNFNCHPKSIKEYEDVLLNLDTLKINIKHEEVCEYYFMKNIYNNENWLFRDYQAMIKKMGGYKEQFSSKIYDYWLNEWDEELDNKVMQRLRNFLSSQQYRMNFEGP